MDIQKSVLLGGVGLVSAIVVLTMGNVVKHAIDVLGTEK